MNIIIIGYYGSNFGDLLMLKALVENLPSTSVSIMTYGSKTPLLDQPFIKSRSVEIIELKKSNNPKILKMLNTSEAIIWGGGTCFMDEGGTGGVKYMLLAKLLGCKVYYAGIGADSHNKLSTKFCMLVASIISTAIYARDNQSIKAFNKINIFSAKKIIKVHDLAYANNIDDTYLNISSERFLLFCPRNLENYKNLAPDTNQKLLNMATNTAKNLKLNKIVILNADPSVDSEITEQAATHFKDAGMEVEIIQGDKLEICSASLANCEFLLTVRLHPAVIARENSIPFALFNYSEKNRKFAEESGTLEHLILQEEIDGFIPLFTTTKRIHKKCLKTETIQVIRNLVKNLN